MLFTRGFLFGFTLAIAIGPIALLIIRYAATDGFWAGLASACGAALADLTYATVALTVGLAIAPLLEAYTTLAQTIASLTLIAFGLWMLWIAIRSQRQQPSASKQEPSMPAGRRHGLVPFVTTYVLTAVNPLTVIAFLAFIGQLPPDASVAARTVAAAGLFAGSLSVQVVLSICGALLGRVVATGRGIQFLNIASGVGVVIFGVAGLLG